MLELLVTRMGVGVDVEVELDGDGDGLLLVVAVADFFLRRFLPSPLPMNKAIMLGGW